MKMLTDIEIARGAKMKPISEIAEALGIPDEYLEPYGRYKAKIEDGYLRSLEGKKEGKLILVTAINPTPAGEGKTTTTIGLGQAFAKLNKSAVIALREPSLGPVFGVKGGAAGGGYSQVVPMEDINLHFTGDIHAVGAANNLICAALDNHLQRGNKAGIDPKKINIKRVVDMNDRSLRNIVIGLGAETDGVVRSDSFSITVASEIMAILCLSKSIKDLKKRVGNMVIAYSGDGKPVKASELKIEGAVAALLKDAIKPNLVQTLENTPCFIHGGPFANIAHGCNSLIATKTALKTADYVITEAGFGADLGAEKFFDIKCRKGELKPSCAVLVATVRALKYNGGVAKADLPRENIQALEEGLCNLGRHIENIKKFNLPVIVAVNSFETDTEDEFETVKKYAGAQGVPCIKCTAFANGGDGAIDLAQAVLEACEKPSTFKPLYEDSLPVEKKIKKVAKEIYRAKHIFLTASAKKAIEKIEADGYGNLPVCIAKTQYSFSDDPKQLGAPEGFTLTVSEIRLSAGAGFIVALTGKIMTMPGLPEFPAYEKIDIDSEGNISGLF